MIYFQVWEIIPPRVRNPKHAKSIRWTSFHRDDKTYPHTTIGGVGCVGRLRKDRRRKP